MARVIVAIRKPIVFVMRRLVIISLILVFVMALLLVGQVLFSTNVPTDQSNLNLDSPVLGIEDALLSLSNLDSGQVVSVIVVAPIVLLAGASEAIGQVYILFANRVKPLRFGLTLFINVLLFFVNFIINVMLVWVIGRYAFGYDAAVIRAIFAVGLSYQPLLLGFLSVLPYFGSYLMYVLYFASYVLLGEILIQFGYSPIEAFISVIVPLMIVFVLRATIGRPVVWLSKRLRDLAAGTRLENRVDDALRYTGNYMVE